MARIPQHAGSRSARRRARRSMRPSCERIESRTLMAGGPMGSGMSSLASFLSPKPPPRNPVTTPVVLPPNVDGRIEALFQLSQTNHPLYQGIQGGNVLKVPMFPSTYTGPKRLDLDVIGASVTFSPGRGFVLTGKVLGPINAGDSAVYSFLINRGGARAPGPATIRPSISYDAVVKLTTGPLGMAGSVDLVNSQGESTSTVPLPASSIRLAGNAVNLSLTASLLPATSPSRTASRYACSFQAAVPGGKPDNIAGFVSARGIVAARGAAMGRR